MKRGLLIVLAVIAGLLIPAAVAHADPLQRTTSKDVRGAAATCTVSSTLSRIDCTVRDTLVDKRSVFVEWKAMGRQGQFRNNNGANSERTFGEGLYRGIDSSTLQWKVCVDIPWNNDRCSTYSNHAVGPNGLPIEVYCEAPASANRAAVCHQANNMATDDGWELSRECLIGAGLTAAGLGRDGRAAVGRGVLKFIPGIGWALTIGGVTAAVAGCK